MAVCWIKRMVVFVISNKVWGQYLSGWAFSGQLFAHFQVVLEGILFFFFFLTRYITVFLYVIIWFVFLFFSHWHMFVLKTWQHLCHKKPATGLSYWDLHLRILPLMQLNKWKRLSKVVKSGRKSVIRRWSLKAIFVSPIFCFCFFKSKLMLPEM